MRSILFKNLKQFRTSIKILTFVFALESAFTPLAIAKQEERSNKQKIKEFITITGFGNSKYSYEQVLNKLKGSFHPEFQKILDKQTSIFTNQQMPKMESSTFVDSNGVEQVRLVFKENGKSMTITTGGWENSAFIQFNNSKIVQTDLYDSGKLFSRLVKENPEVFVDHKQKSSLVTSGFALTKEQFAKLSLEKKSEYIHLMREAVETLGEVYENYYKDPTYGVKEHAQLLEVKKSMMWAWVIFGEEVFAKGKSSGQKAKRQRPSSLDGQSCIIAGYLSTYSESRPGAGDYSCGQGSDLGTVTSGCNSEGTNVSYSCNPVVYGYNSSGGNFCVTVPKASSGKRGRDLTSQCNSKASKVDVVNSWIKASKLNVKGVKDKDGKIQVEASDKEFDALQKYAQELENHINAANDAICSTVSQKVQPPPQALLDQQDACVKLNQRLISLEQIKKEVVAPKPDPSQGGECPNGGPAPCDLDNKPIATEPVKSTEPSGVESFLKRWGPGILIGLLAFFGIRWIMRDNKKPNVPQYVPPYPSNLAATTVAASAPAPIPVVPVPVVVKTEGGTGTSGSISGGVR